MSILVFISGLILMFALVVVISAASVAIEEKSVPYAFGYTILFFIWFGLIGVLDEGLRPPFWYGNMAGVAIIGVVYLTARIKPEK